MMRNALGVAFATLFLAGVSCNGECSNRETATAPPASALPAPSQRKWWDSILPGARPIPVRVDDDEHLDFVIWTLHENQPTLEAVSPAANARLWRVRLGFAGPALLVGRSLFVAHGPFVSALRVQNGEVQWRARAPEGKVVTAFCPVEKSLHIRFAKSPLSVPLPPTSYGWEDSTRHAEWIEVDLATHTVQGSAEPRSCAPAWATGREPANVERADPFAGEWQWLRVSRPTWKIEFIARESADLPWWVYADDLEETAQGISVIAVVSKRRIVREILTGEGHFVDVCSGGLIDASRGTSVFRHTLELPRPVYERTTPPIASMVCVEDLAVVTTEQRLFGFSVTDGSVAFDLGPGDPSRTEINRFPQPSTESSPGRL